MYEIYAYQNSDSLFGIFNAVAAIMGSGTYLGAVGAVAFCGFVAAMLAYAFAPEKLQGWKWLATVLLVYSVLFVPRADVGIVDKTGGSAVKIVSNVPFGMAFFGGITSTIGNTLTELFETAFQTIPGAGALPSELTYQKNGLLFGNRLIRETRSIAFLDPVFRTDVLNYIDNCTRYDLADGSIPAAEFAKSEDVWTMMGNTNPARFTTVTTPAGAVDIRTCPQAYVELSLRMPAELTALESHLGFKLNPTLPGDVAALVVAAQIEQAYAKNHISDASSAAADLIRQNALINAMNDAAQLSGQKTNDPALMVLALGRAQAVAQKNAAWMAGAKVAEQALPILRNVIEALTYALFPLVVLLLLLTSGRETMLAVKGYIVVLIWIQLWPPMYAILNYMASIYASFDLAAAADIGGAKALSIRTGSAIYSNAVSAEAVVGSLTAIIPLITWSAIKRMETLGSVVAAGATAISTAVNQTTESGAVGNAAMGNISMDQRTLHSVTSNPFVSRHQSLNGDWLTFDGTGRVALSRLQNEGLARREITVRTSEQDVVAASKSVDSAQADAITAAREEAAAYANVFSRAAARTQSARSGSGTSASSTDEVGADVSNIISTVDSIQRATGVDRSQAAQIAFGAALRGSAFFRNQATAEATTPGFLPARFGAQVDIGASGSFDMRATADKSFSSKLTDAEQSVLSNLTTEQIGEVKRFADRVSRDSQFLRSLATDERESRDLSSRLATTSSRAEQAQATLNDRTAYAEEVRSSYEKGESFSINVANDPRYVGMQEQVARWIDAGYDNQALSVLMSSELARRSLGPHRVFSDSSAMPTSFDAVRDAHGIAVSEPRLNPAISRKVAHNDAAVVESALANSAPSVSDMSLNAGTPSMLRQQVTERTAQAKEAASGQRVTFDQLQQITRDPDGTIGTRKSLLLDAGRQAKKDGAAAIENAKDIVKGALPSKNAGQE